MKRENPCLNYNNNNRNIIYQSNNYSPKNNNNSNYNNNYSNYQIPERQFNNEYYNNTQRTNSSFNNNYLHTMTEYSNNNYNDNNYDYSRQIPDNIYDNNIDENVDETQTNINDFENNVMYNSNSGEKIVYNGIDDENYNHLFIQHKNNDYYPSKNKNIKEEVKDEKNES